MTRPFFVLVLILACCSEASVFGSPITYDFNGRLLTPVDGATTFSGSFTYDSSLPFASGTTQTSSMAYYGDDPATAGKLINLSFSFGNTSSSSLGPILGTELSVSHDQSWDELNLDVRFSDGAKAPMAVIGMLNDNTQSPGPFTSTAPPSSLALASFNWGAQLIFYPDMNSSDASIVGTITGLVPAGTPLPPVPSAVPEPTTCVVILAGFAGLLWRQRPGRILPGRRT